jgi:hypothetical protein
MHTSARRRRDPFAVDVKIDDSIENVKCFGVLAMQMQTKRKTRA